MRTNGEILLEAYTIINGQRESHYGNPASTFARTAALWSAYLGHAVNCKDVAICMVLLKFCWEAYHHKQDNLLDAAGYIGMAADMAGVNTRETDTLGDIGKWWSGGAKK
ncbi:MAG: DUF6378 domain-containing protein [Desulfovibrio sp.]|jgi:hypothetical protein|nr:DUF6378 domain-containing protein [Desulfovibrio sp.]